MALVDPNIAMGYRGIEVPNQLAQYGQLTQIQNAQNQNRMADLQAQEYERARSEEEGTRNFLRGKDLKSPEVRLGLMEFGKTGLAMAKSLSDQEAAAATLANTKSQTSERDFKLQKDKLKHGWESMGDAPTPQAAIERLNDGVAKGYFDMKAASAEIQKLESMTTPEQYRQYRIDKLTGIMDAKDQLTNLLPKVARQEAGGQIVSIQDNPMMPGYGQPIAGAVINKTETFADKNARGQLAVSQGQLGLARQRLAQEAQGVTYQVNDQGDIVALPSRLSAGASPVARPVTGQDGAPIKGAPKSKDISVSEQQASYNIARVLNAADEIGKITKKDPKALAPGALEAAAKAIGAEGTANTMRSTNRQIVNGAQRDALDALLYLATGAAYNKEQLQGAFEAYIPSYTDDKGTRDAKQARMTNLIQDAKVRAGKAWTPKMDSAMQSLTGSSAPAAAANIPAPSGVDAAIWNVMTPEERKLWAK